MTSKLINDLHSVPEIVAALGLSIADAQRRLNVDYIQSLERIVVMAQSMLGDKATDAGGNPVDLATSPEQKAERDRFRATIIEMLLALAPSRHQFTETTLTVRLDLAQSLDVSATAGVAAGVGAVAVNAALSVGYGYDYRAAAEVHTVMHAIPPDVGVMRTLLDRADQLKKQALELPEGNELDARLHEAAGRVFERMTGLLPAKVGGQ